MKKAFLFATAFVVAAQSVYAQTPGVAGTYAVEYSVRMMTNDREPAPTETVAKVKLVLEQKGDSVFGTWQMTAPRESPAQQLRGKVEGKNVRLWGTVSGHMRGPDGSERTVSMTQEYVMTIEGDVLKGSITVHPEEGIEIHADPRPFTGKRAG